ncbi:MAG: addiction module protein [Bacteroidota bacterium]
MKTAYLKEILALSKHDRLLIVQRILDSIRLEEESGSPLSEQWKSELDRRSKLLAEGKTQLYSWDEIKDSLTKDQK